MYEYLYKCLKEYDSKGFAIKCRYDKKLVEEINSFTSFLNEYDDVSLSERVWYCKNKITEVQLCPYCKTRKRRFRKMNIGLFPTCGDPECKRQGIIKGSKAPRDWDDIQEKMKATYKERTGYEHNSQNPENIKKTKETCLKKYGVETPVKTEKAKEAREKTFVEKYGSQGNMLKENIIKTYGSFSNQRKILSDRASKTFKINAFNLIKEKAKEIGITILSDNYNATSYEDIEMQCDRCGMIFKKSRSAVNHFYMNKLSFCPHCDYKNLTFRSSGERVLGEEIIKFYDGDIQFNKRISNFEVDILIPKKQLAIDYNGIYWHSEMYKEKDVHKTKKERLEKLGYKFIQIWEDDWNDPIKKEIIISRLKSKIGVSERIFARKCTIKELTTNEEIKACNKFLSLNHLQGVAPSSRKFALLYKNEIVEVATFGKSRSLISGNNNEIELIRLCTKNGYNVVGGFSKLMKHAAKEMKCKRIISYADCDWISYDSNGYLNSGFKLIKETACNYWWSKDGIRENRMKFTKAKLIKMGYDPQKTENEIMKEIGYRKVYGSGNLLFEYTI